MLFVFLLREDSFLGATEKIGYKDNGIFRGILELLAVYDPILHDHLNKIKQSEKANKRMQAHYLSHQTQNEGMFRISALAILSYNKSKN